MQDWRGVRELAGKDPGDNDQEEAGQSGRTVCVDLPEATFCLPGTADVRIKRVAATMENCGEAGSEHRASWTEPRAEALAADPAPADLSFLGFLKFRS